MAHCVICGNSYDYDRSFQVIRSDRAYAFDSLECTIHFLKRCSAEWAERDARRRRPMLPIATLREEGARGSGRPEARAAKRRKV